MASKTLPDKGYMGDTPHTKTNQYMLIEDRVHEVHTAVVHTFSVGDVDDPFLYAAQPISEWQNSDAGKWVMAHTVETPMWHRQHDLYNYGHSFAITAKLIAKDYSFFLLKWGEKGTHRK